MLQFIGPMVVPLAPFFQSYGVNLPSSLSTIISRLSTLIPAHLRRPKYGYIATAREDGPRELSGPAQQNYYSYQNLHNSARSPRTSRGKQFGSIPGSDGPQGTPPKVGKGGLAKANLPAHRVARVYAKP